MKRLRSSFMALLGREETDAPLVVVERIRRAMLLVLDAHAGDSHHMLDAKICLAGDIAELWYLRPDLMHAISAHRDEAVATALLLDITVLFQGHHPGASPSRWGSL